VIDSEDKRRSVVGLWSVIRVLPQPNNEIDSGDRAHLWVYRGMFEDEDEDNAVFFGMNA